MTVKHELTRTVMMVDNRTMLVYLTFGSMFLSSVYSAMVATEVANMDACTGILCDALGLAFGPRQNFDTTLIRFNPSRPSTYTPYVDHIGSFLQYYDYEYQGTGDGIMVDCSTFTEFRPHEDWDKACRFDIVDLGADCVKQQSFGYEDGQPCVLLKLNRIFDWVPEPYSNETRPDAIADTWTQYAISVNCEGENAADRDNIGNIMYFPSNGFPFKYFPYRNQQSYRSPLVFVRFDNPNPAQLLMITCKVYAKNIKHNDNERSGMVHFELLVD